MPADPLREASDPAPRIRRPRRPSPTGPRLAALEAALRAGGESRAALARRFDLSPMTVSRIARRIAAPAARTTSATPVAVRLSRAELDRFDAAWRRVDGLSSRAEAMRRLVRQAAGMLDADPATLAEWREIARQLRGAAVNLNQMARAANAGLPGWGPREEGELRRLARIAGTLARNYAGAVAVAGRKSRAADLFESGAPWP